MNEDALYQIMLQALQQPSEESPATPTHRTTLEPQFRMGPNGQLIEIPRKATPEATFKLNPQPYIVKKGAPETPIKSLLPQRPPKAYKSLEDFFKEVPKRTPLTAFENLPFIRKIGDKAKSPAELLELFLTQ